MSNTSSSSPRPLPSALRPLLSVIVPVRNEERFIERTLRDLLAQDRTGLDLEILVVDGESADRTREIVRGLAASYREIRLLENPKRLSSAARNVGVRHATGEFVLIVDGHCQLPDRRMLGNVVRAFETSGADCLGRPQPLDVTGATALQRAIAAARASRLGHHPESFIYASQPRFVPAKSVAVAYRRDVFDRVGYFDESFDACEDYEFNTRTDKAGLTCYFEPRITVRYYPRSSLSGVFRQLVRYGRGRIRLLRKHAETASWKTLLPALFVLGTGFGWLPGLAVPWLLISYMLGVGLYISIIIAASLWIAGQQRDPAILAWLPLAFATIHVGAGTGLLLEAIWPGTGPGKRQEPRVAPSLPPGGQRRATE